MTALQQVFSAEIGIFSFDRNRRVFTCMTFREPFTKTIRDNLIYAGLAGIAQLEEHEKTEEESAEPFNIEISKQGLAQCPWDGPPHLTLICSHSALPLAKEYMFAEQIERDLQAMHDHPHTFMDVPRILFQSLERLSMVRIVHSVIPPPSCN